MKKKVVSVFLNLKKAFNSVVHYIIIIKLKYFGVGGIGLPFLKSYLINKYQVKISNISTNELFLCLRVQYYRGESRNVLRRGHTHTHTLITTQ
jgi:hypothetical protein